MFHKFNVDGLTSVNTRSEDGVLVELSVDQTALRSETTLEVPVLVVHNLKELGVVGADCQLGEFRNFVGLRSEGVDGFAQLGDADVAGARGNELAKLFEVKVHLVRVIGKIERDQFCGCQIVCKERQVLAHRFVVVESRVAIGRHPIVGVVVAVVRVKRVSGTAIAAHIDLFSVSCKA
jgi:hypothetical protein